MNCADLNRMLAEYVGDMLPTAERAALSLHIQGCRACTELIQPLRDLECRQVLDSLADYLDHTMPAADAQSLELHLKLCAECEDYLHAYRTTIRFAKASAEIPAALPPLPAELVQSVLAWKKKRSEERP